ncbi:MAG: hypothetical protein Kow0098_18760 [Ignavibacteriaceae bacterium]
MKYNIVLFISLIFSFSSISNPQGSSGENAKFEYRSLIDMPTAGILEKGFVGLTTEILPDGVLIETIEVGVFNNISFGISYGGSNVIGRGTPDWYKIPAVNIRFRIFNESVTMPAITAGFDSQGKGLYFDQANRYSIKSPGFFGAVSKNFAFLGYLSLHGSVNYSLEGKDGDNFVNFLIGFEKTLGENLSVIGEYDLAFNDNETDSFGAGSGYLNMGLRWAVGEGFTIGFDLRDLLKNKKWSPGSADRALRIEFIQSIF